MPRGAASGGASDIERESQEGNGRRPNLGAAPEIGRQQTRLGGVALVVREGALRAEVVRAGLGLGGQVEGGEGGSGPGLTVVLRGGVEGVHRGLQEGGAEDDGNFNEIVGDSSNNSLIGSSSTHDFLIANDGNDYLRANQGKDKLFGGGGNDELPSFSFFISLSLFFYLSL